MPRVYFAGGSASGKTTLARQVRDHFGLPLLPSAARLVAEERGLIDTGKWRADSPANDWYQTAVLLRQLALEYAVPDFVSDRSTFDNYMYQTFCSPRVLRENWLEYAELRGRSLREPDATVFLVMPNDDAFRNAQQDGERIAFLDRTEIAGMYGIARFCLELFQVPYTLVAPGSRDTQWNLVQSVLEGKKLSRNSLPTV